MIGCKDSCVRFVGRWQVADEKAVATAPGSHFYLAFAGKQAVLHFETLWLIHPYPHLWISVDDGAWIEVPVDKMIRIHAKDDGNHIAKIVYKSAIEKAHRWYQPLCGCVELTGIDALPGILPKFNQKTIEFVGDSITEGVFVDEQFTDGTKYHGRPYQDDSMATYAWLSAEALNLEPLIMGYGAVGVTKSGQGSVPKASAAYPYCYNGAEVEYQTPDIIVVNHGANDQFGTGEEFVKCYLELLDVIMDMHPATKLVLLQPFCGVFTEEMKQIQIEFEKKYDKHVHLILTNGWIGKEPLHPTREGHQMIARYLIEELKKIGV